MLWYRYERRDGSRLGGWVLAGDAPPTQMEVNKKIKNKKIYIYITLNNVMVQI